MMLASLKKQGFDDADLFHMIREAGERGGTKALAKRLEGAQLANWIAKGNTVDDVSRLLKLRKQHNFFDQLAVGYWARFATRLGEGHADEMMLASLKTLYGDEYLASMLKRGRDFGRWKSVAARLEQQLWLSEGLSAEQALKRLMDGGEDIFSEKVSNVWFSYVTKLAKAGENPSETALSILKGHFTNEWKLAGEMAFGLKEDSWNKAIQELQRHQFQQWRDQGYTVKNVSAKLKEHVDNPFSREKALRAFRKFLRESVA